MHITLLSRDRLDSIAELVFECEQTVNNRTVRGPRGMITYYVVQGFVRGKNGYPIPEESREVPNARYARALCERLMADRMAAVAFSRSGDPATGEWQDAEIICRLGAVSDELLAEAAA